MSTRTISTNGLLADLRAGMNHADLMSKYGVSESELDRVVGSLAQAGLFVTREGNPGRSDSTRPVRTLWRCPACRTPQIRAYETCPQCGVIVGRFVEKKNNKNGASADAELQDTGVADQPERTSGRLGMRLPPKLTVLWIILGLGASLVVLAAMRPFPDLSWVRFILMSLLLVGELSACSWFIVKGVYLFRVRNNQDKEDVLIVGAVVIAAAIVMITFILAGVRGESIRIKYKSVYAPLIREIHSDLSRLDGSMSIEQHRDMIQKFAGQLTRIELRINDEERVLVRMVRTALSSLRQADEQWSQITDTETSEARRSVTGSVEPHGKASYLVEARQRHWDSFRKECLEILRYVDRKTK